MYLQSFATITPNSRTCLSCPQSPELIGSHSPFFPSADNHEPACLDLPVLDVSYKYNHILCGLVCLAYFSLTISGFIHVIACVRTAFIFEAEQCQCMDSPHLCVHSSVDGYLSCCHFLTVVISPALTSACFRSAGPLTMHEGAKLRKVMG